MRLRLFLIPLLAALALPAVPAVAAEPWQQVVDLSYPTLPQAGLTDSYTACRDGCARLHQAADLMGQKMWPLYAAVDGTVCRIDDGAEDSYGRHLTLCGDDGNRYRYLHLNNDTPGTDDGVAGLEHVYAAGIRQGLRVARGQLLAYMGDSGNAEGTAPHLHFDIFVPGVVNPWGEERINPYPSLVEALARNDVPDGSAVYTEPTQRLGGVDRVETAVMLSRRTYESANTVVLATSLTPQDALVGGPLAAAYDGPVLITPPKELLPVVADEIRRLGATNAIVIGEALNDLSAVQAAVGSDGTVTRIAGENVHRTSVAVAEAVWEATGAGGPGVSTITGEKIGFDPMAEQEREPTLVVSGDRDRSPAVRLDGARLPDGTRELYVWLAGVDPDDVREVDFSVDGRGDRDEEEWPYDLAGTAWGTTPETWDMSRVRPGEHTVAAEIERADGREETVVATFTLEDDSRGRTAIVALGKASAPGGDWPDALAASWYGAVRSMPVLLTAHDRVPPAISAAVADVDELLVAGGTAAISDDRLAELRQASGATPRRLAGKDRYATADAVALDLVDRSLVSRDRLFVATGHDWPDAVTAGPAVARAGDLLLLIHGPSGGPPTAQQAIQRHAKPVDEVVALGGIAAVTDAVLHRAAFWAV